MARLIVFFLILILPTLGWTQNATAKADAISFAELFKQGTQHYVAKEYDKSRDAFAKALEQDPHNATTLTNLALAQYQLGKKSLAIGLLRKALNYEPELPAAKAGLKFALSQMEIKEVPHQIEPYEAFRARVLAPVPLIAYLVLTTLLFFSAGWTLLSYIGRKRRAFADEKASPSFPTVAVLMSLGFVVCASLLSLKIYDQSVVRATIVDDRVSLQTAPGDNQAAVLDLYGGMEVIVQTQNKDWVQVTYPGSLTGWVKTTSILY
ncbi:MAG: hypothetical protein ACM3MG_06990 [Bacillota bacterium]